jgi:transcriptional regulator with XRE-family HTH domain
LSIVHYTHAQQLTAYKGEWFKSSKVHATRLEGARLMLDRMRPDDAESGDARTTSTAGDVSSTVGSPAGESRTAMSQARQSKIAKAAASENIRTETAVAPTVLRILLGTQLRRLRESRGISAQTAANAIRGSESKISRIELGRNAVREVDIADLLNLYGITDAAERDQLLTLAGQANEQGWWHRYQDVLPTWFQSYIGLEESAESIRSFDAQFVPGLLQTEDYATAVIQLGAYARADAHRRVYLRRERQRRFATGGLRLRAIIDEAALRRPIGSPQVRRAQLEHLLEISDRPGLTIQVCPLLTGASYAAPGSFSILKFATDDVPDIVYVEQLTSALYLDKRVDVDRYAQAMDQIAESSTTGEQTTDIIRAMIEDLEESE